MEERNLMAGDRRQDLRASSSPAWLLPSLCDGSRVGVPAPMATDAEQDDEDALGAIMRCRSRTGSAAPVRTARWRA